ncbi:MAG: threonine--tRNA ligase [Mycoplasmoidaceae bacterium]
MRKIISNTIIILLDKVLCKIYQNFKYINFFYDEDKCFFDFYTSDTVSINDFDKINSVFLDEIGNNNKIKFKDYFIYLEKDVCSSYKCIKYFKLMHLGGIGLNSYRISFCTFENKNEYESYLKYIAEMQQKDHRKIGNDLSIFCFSDKIGLGLPLFLPNGAFIKDKISQYLKSICLENGFNLVSTPILGKKELYITSGHWDLYKENNFSPIKIDEEIYMLRPMTCPHHMILFNNDKKSYRDLPLAYCEDSILHRYESSGGLIGLERVRSMELFDTHIFVSENQIDLIIQKIYKLILEVYKKLEIVIDRIDLSLRSNNKNKYFDNDEMWENAENKLRSVLKILKLDFLEVKGEAAFYGPKIDFQYKTVNGKYISISTIQLDFLLPEKFKLEYINEEGILKRPIIIHLGLIGTYERFISCLLSQKKGNLPLWLVKTQVVILPINSKFHSKYANKIAALFKKHNIRFKIDDSNERLSKKIHFYQVNKIPFQIILGDDEVNNENISYREYGQKDTNKISIEDFIKLIN